MSELSHQLVNRHGEFATRRSGFMQKARIPARYVPVSSGNLRPVIPFCLRRSLLAKEKHNNDCDCLAAKRSSEWHLLRRLEKLGKYSIGDLNGKITLGENTGYLREEIRSLLSKGTKEIVLNMAEVGYVDSAGLGELVGLYTTVANRGGSLKLLNLQSKMRNLMEVAKLYTVFPVFEDEKAAVSSFDESDNK